MAEDSVQPAAGGHERPRGSLAKALDKIKTAIKRRGSSSKSGKSSGSKGGKGSWNKGEKPSAHAKEDPRGTGPNTSRLTTTDVPQSELLERSNSPPTRQLISSPLVSAKPHAAVDRSVGAESPEDVGAEELAAPMRSGGTEISTTQARTLSIQEGIEHKPSNSQVSPPTTMRRVLRPIRLRTHWTCHECEHVFGAERECRQCGHGRCGQCVRRPPKRVDEMEGEQNGANLATTVVGVISTGEGQDSIPTDADEYDTNEVDVYEFALWARPHSGVQTFVRPIPRHPKGTANYGQHLSSNEAPMVKAVQRVYRKPRQRVRYTCENCRTVFSNQARCQECGHERCGDCHREP